MKKFIDILILIIFIVAVILGIGYAILLHSLPAMRY